MFTVQEAGVYLGVTAETVRRAYRKGEVAGLRDGLKIGSPLRFTGKDLDTFRESRLKFKPVVEPVAK